MSLMRERVLYTVEKYLAMERASPARHEYVDGEIYEMAGESISHGRICTNLVAELRNQLKDKPCDVLSKDMKVRRGVLPDLRNTMKGFLSYPDVVIVCGQPQFHDEFQDVLINPDVIIEVLSETTEAFDLGEKFRRYRSFLPTLTDYVLVAQDKPLIDHFSKRDDGSWTLVSSEGLANALRLPPIGCTLALAEVYDRVEFPVSGRDIENSRNAV